MRSVAPFYEPCKFGVCYQAEQFPALNPESVLYLTRTLQEPLPANSFVGNQLLPVSFGLFPLYPGYAKDLHIITATGLHPDFSGLRRTQA
jgi:hypothetical protein